MIELEYEMTYAETIDGPLGPTTGSALGERLCWQITSATLHGPRINATLAMPGTDWASSDMFNTTCRSSPRVHAHTPVGAASEA